MLPSQRDVPKAWEFQAQQEVIFTFSFLTNLSPHCRQTAGKRVALPQGACGLLSPLPLHRGASALACLSQLQRCSSLEVCTGPSDLSAMWGHPRLHAHFSREREHHHKPKQLLSASGCKQSLHKDKYRLWHHHTSLQPMERQNEHWVTVLQWQRHPYPLQPLLQSLTNFSIESQTVKF